MFSSNLAPFRFCSEVPKNCSLECSLSRGQHARNHPGSGQDKSQHQYPKSYNRKSIRQLSSLLSHNPRNFTCQSSIPPCRKLTTSRNGQTNEAMCSSVDEVVFLLSTSRQVAVSDQGQVHAIHPSIHPTGLGTCQLKAKARQDAQPVTPIDPSIPSLSYAA